MSIDSDKKSQPAESDLDCRVIREMESKIAAKEVSAEWKPWAIALVAILLVSGILALGVCLAPVFFMRGFN